MAKDGGALAGCGARYADTNGTSLTASA